MTTQARTRRRASTRNSSRRSPARTVAARTAQAALATFPPAPGPLPAWTTPPGAPAPAAATHMVGIFLKSLTIHTAQFTSRDFSGRREGSLNISCCGQSTSIAYEDKAEAPGQPASAASGTLLYLGIHPGRVSLSLQLMESDEEVRKFFGSASKLASALAGSPLAGLHPAIAPGAQLVSTLMATIQAQILDDQEFQFFAVYDNALIDGMSLRIIGLNSSGQTLLEATLEIADFGPTRAGAPVSIRVAPPELQFNTQTVSRPPSGSHSRPGAGTISRRNYTARQWIDDYKAHWFNCEAGTGRSRFHYSARYFQAAQTLRWHQAELFVAPTGSNSSRQDRHLIPFTLAFTLTPKEFKPEAILTLAGQAIDFSAALGADAADAKAYLKKASAALGPILAKLGGKSIELYAFEGLLFLHPAGQPDAIDQRLMNLPGILPLTQSAPGLWTASFQPDISLAGKSIGKISIGIEARALTGS